MSIENETLNDRGFKTRQFEDNYGAKCSIRESSACSVEGDEGWYIWLGVDEPECKLLVPGKGWTDYPLPTAGPNFLHSGQMHLSQKRVGELIPHLMYFAETGSLPNSEQHAAFVAHLEEHVQPTINDFFSGVST